MAKIIILGTAAGVPDGAHEGTHFAVVSGGKTLLVDCAGNPMARLKQAGIELDSIEDLVLSHYHPDHMYGVPMLLMGMWLLKRRKPLRVHGLRRTLSRARQTMKLFDWDNWKGFYPLEFHELPAKQMEKVIERQDMLVFSSPVKHVIPAIGLRFDFVSEKRSAAYSCDTEPCRSVDRLAKGVEVLIHEATGEGRGHTSPRQAGETAARTGANRLCLIHYPTSIKEEEWLSQAGSTFGRKVVLTQDFMEIEI